MTIACLPPGSDETQLRRVLAGVQAVDALVLPTANVEEGGEWLRRMLVPLRRELFLQPELQVLVSVAASDVDQAVIDVAECFCEANSNGLAIARVATRRDVTQVVDWLTAGESFAHIESRELLPDDVQLESLRVQFGAAPIVEACEIGASFLIAESPAPGALALGSVYSSLAIAAQDWDELAKIAVMARLLETPGGLFPLWLEVIEERTPTLVGLPKHQSASLQRRLNSLAEDILGEAIAPDVTIDLSQVQVDQVGTGRFHLAGIQGGPPTSQYSLVVEYRDGAIAENRRWPTTVAKKLADWDVTVLSASDWRDRLGAT